MPGRIIVLRACPTSTSSRSLTVRLDVFEDFARHVVHPALGATRSAANGRFAYTATGAYHSYAISRRSRNSIGKQREDLTYYRGIYYSLLRPGESFSNPKSDRQAN